MRTEDIDKIMRVAQWFYAQGEVDGMSLVRVQHLCVKAVTADREGCACRRDNLIIAALDVLFGGGIAG